MKVWDLQSVLAMEICDRCPQHKLSSDLLLKVIPPPPPQKYDGYLQSTTLVSADEFQFIIADIDQVDKKKKGSFLFIKSFVGKMGTK